MEPYKLISSGAAVVPRAPSSKASVQYPSTWFIGHKGQKPIIPIKLTTGNLKDAASAVRKQMTDNQVDVELATTFLYYYLQTILEDLEEDWTSYGTTISEKMEGLTPLHLADFRSTVTVKNYAAKTEVGEKDYLWMAIYLFGIYRLIKAKHADYRTTLLDNIGKQIQVVGGGEIVPDMVDGYTSWGTNKAYNGLTAVTDMFFHKFPNNEASKIRIGTVGSRYKDCAALISYGYILNILGITEANELLPWIFIQQIGVEVLNMMKPEEELTDEYSYFPYQIDLGLVTKSAYSATANPHFFEYVHIIGALLRTPRSQNAKHITDAQKMNLIMNSACVAFVFSHVLNLHQVFSRGKKTAASADDVTDYDDNEHFLSSCKDPVVWCTYLSENNAQIPPFVRNWLRQVHRSIKDPRVGTIDEHLKNTLGSV